MTIISLEATGETIVDDGRIGFLADVLDGLLASPKSIPGKYLWDEEGSQIFAEITATAAYYQTAAEHALTSRALPDIAAILGRGGGATIVGRGASSLEHASTCEVCDRLLSGKPHESDDDSNWRIAGVRTPRKYEPISSQACNCIGLQVFA